MPRTETEPTNVGRLPRLVGGPVGWTLNLFSSIWLGIILLIILFAYCTIGSIGVWLPGSLGLAAGHDWIHDIYWMIPWTQLHLRQAPGLEMTEFEWFHWWPFNLLMLLICINVIVATIRRIPFNVVNLGVWMIHTGIIVLAVGSVMYFATKLEGDAPVARRQVLINVPGHEPVSMAAMPGNVRTIDTERGTYSFRIFNIDPDWEILSGDDAGQRTYGVQVAVQTPEQEYIRQLLAGYPQYTEDTIMTGRRDQPMARAIRELGKHLVDESTELALDYKPQEHFYLMNSAAIYLREKGTTEWFQRPIANLPRYNDYIDSPSAVWGRPDMPSSELPLRPLSIDVPPVDSRDPLAGERFTVTGYLRYAFPQSRPMPGGRELNPVVDVRLVSEGTSGPRASDYRLFAKDPHQRAAEGGRLRFEWIDAEKELDQIVNSPPARLQARVGDSRETFELNARPLGADAPFQQIGETEYAYRVEALPSDLTIEGFSEPVSIAVVLIRTPERTFRRWVFDQPGIPSRDLPIDGGSMHDEPLPLDENLEMTYTPARDRALLTLVGGPTQDDLHLVLRLGEGNPIVRRLVPGERVRLQAGTTLEVRTFLARARMETRPVIVPSQQREANDGQQRSMIRVQVPAADEEQRWLTRHHYAFPTESDVLRRFPYRPAEITLADGRVIELLYGRERRKLPAPVVLDDFVLTTHIGGFTGSTLSIRDWTSVIRFADGHSGASWTETAHVSMNNPASHEGFWFFQAQWDPPDPPRFEGDARSNGLNFTVLGVGNRNGVITQLAGCVIAVLGMIYAFYVKPILKRRRAQRVYAGVTAMNAVMRTTGAPARSAAPVEPAPASATTSSAPETARGTVGSLTEERS